MIFEKQTPNFPSFECPATSKFRRNRNDYCAPLYVDNVVLFGFRFLSLLCDTDRSRSARIFSVFWRILDSRTVLLWVERGTNDVREEGVWGGGGGRTMLNLTIGATERNASGPRKFLYKCFNNNNKKTFYLPLLQRISLLVVVVVGMPHTALKKIHRSLWIKF